MVTKTRKRGTRSDDPILRAKTVKGFVKAANKAYGFDLPESFPPGTVLGQLWALKIKVQKDPEAGVIYRAVAQEVFPYLGLTDQIPGLTIADISDDKVFQLRNATGPSLALSQLMEGFHHGKAKQKDRTRRGRQKTSGGKARGHSNR